MPQQLAGHYLFFVSVSGCCCMLSVCWMLAHAIANKLQQSPRGDHLLCWRLICQFLWIITSKNAKGRDENRRDQTRRHQFEWSLDLFARPQFASATAATAAATAAASLSAKFRQAASIVLARTWSWTGYGLMRQWQHLQQQQLQQQLQLPQQLQNLASGHWPGLDKILGYSFI